MRNKLFSLLLAIPAIAFAAPNPFVAGSWHLDNYTLTTHQHGPMPYTQYDYSLSYQLPNSTSDNNNCTVTSPNTLSCPDLRDTVTYNATAHSVSLNGDYTFYEKGYEPADSALTGTWNAITPDQCEYASIVIPHATTDATIFKHVVEYFTHGGGVTSENTLYLGKTEYDNVLVLSTWPTLRGTAFQLYDATDTPINDMLRLNEVKKLDDGWGCTLVKQQ